METTPLHRMVDRVLGGCLDETLSCYAEEGLSPGRMALRLAADHQVEVSGQTIKKWVAALPSRDNESSAQTPQTAQSARDVQTARKARFAQKIQTAQTAQVRDSHVAAMS